MAANKTLPPVRNRDYRAKKREKKKKKEEEVTGDGDTKTEEAKQASRIKSSDYQSWDKFDVEKVLEEMDKEEDCPAESNESDSEEAAVDPEKALAEKEKVDIICEALKKGKIDVVLYRPITINPMCCYRVRHRVLQGHAVTMYAVAESDCNLAIALDSKYFKAYARRGAARFALKKYEPALEDYEMVLKLEPDNTEAQNEIKKIREALGHQVAAVASKAAEPLEAPAVDPDQQRRIEEQQRRQEAVFQKDRGNAYFKEGKYEAAVECYTRGMEADHMNVLLPANRAMAYLKLEKFKEAEEDCTKAIFLDITYSKAFARRGTARVALGRLEEARQDFQQLLKLEPGNKQALNELQKLQLDTGSSGRLQAVIGSQMRTVQPIDKPTHLRSTQIKSEAYAKIFHNSLEPDILNLILRTLHDFYMKNEEPAVILETLRSLASVRRFDMAVMFMSSPEKKVLKELFDFLHQADLDRSSITALQKKYGV
ncbi:RNA polymerase II-associated protein 3 [Neolamprologus brichardi]|uniref:RNA polymerase II-associated protein 3 n=1 Tax=Neolamprologus brichardi TaxID=32507 RepID=UPI001643C943|nr:RNA polymerase II-associated protein 3 [Neolamprologus brichardi]